MTRTAPWALALALLLAAGACSGDDDGDTATTTTTTAAAEADGGAAGEEPGSTDLAGLASYDTVGAMAEDLDAAGITCQLEYEGLQDAEKEVSICTIDGEFAQLTVWVDPAVVETLAGATDGTIALGANWTVDVDTPETATAVAAALGGTAPPAT